MTEKDRLELKRLWNSTIVLKQLVKNGEWDEFWRSTMNYSIFIGENKLYYASKFLELFNELGIKYDSSYLGR